MITTLELPFPPTSNHAYATVTTRGGARRVKSAAARNYALVAQILTKRVHPIPPFTTNDRISISIALHPPDSRRFDIANREKILVDAISSVLGFDDSQVDRITMERMPPDPAGRVIVRVETLHSGN